MQGYTDTIRRYAACETHIGLLQNADGTGEVGLTSEEAGKRLAVRFTLNLDQDSVKEIRFQVFGCGFTIAACAAAAEICEGRPLKEILSCTPATIEAALEGLPQERSYCAELANQALQAAIHSARSGSTTVLTDLESDRHADGARFTADNPLYRALLATSTPAEISPDDRQMFAGLLTVASQEGPQIAASLGLTENDLESILASYFPDFDHRLLQTAAAENEPAAVNPEILTILRSHIPDQTSNRIAEWLAGIIATRTVQPGHLWCAMGFLERPQLTAAIKRHLPSLAAANNQGMRWKRYLFKQVCDLNGGTLCKTPNCNDCSDYALCFAPQDN